MDYTSSFNVASQVYHSVMDVAEAGISVASVPIGTAAAGVYTMMGTGYMGLGLSPQMAMVAGGGAAVVALGYTSYWAYKSIRNIFTKEATNPVESTQEKPAIVMNRDAMPALA